MATQADRWSKCSRQSAARAEPERLRRASVAPPVSNTRLVQYDQAIQFLLTANQLKPDNYDVLVSLGTANMDAAHWDAAEKWFKAAQVKNSKDVTVAASLAFVSLQKRDVKAANETLRTLKSSRRTAPISRTSRKSSMN
jgi:cytochrome c-type biogenesis protein CcmH/NrfG